MQKRSTSESCTMYARKFIIQAAATTKSHLLRKEQPQMQAPSMMLLVPSAQLSSSTAVAPFETHSGFRCISCASKVLSPICRCPQGSTHQSATVYPLTCLPASPVRSESETEGAFQHRSRRFGVSSFRLPEAPPSRVPREASRPILRAAPPGRSPWRALAASSWAFTGNRSCEHPSRDRRQRAADNGTVGPHAAAGPTAARR